MVDPKKEYELLMRYLQGSTQKREPAAAPEQAFPEEWQRPVPPPDVVHTAEPRATLPPRTTPQPYHFRLPKWQPVSLRKKARIAISAAALLCLIIFLWKAYSFYQLSPDAIYKRLYLPYRVAIKNAEPVLKNSIAQYYTTDNFVAATLQAKKQHQLSDSEKLMTGLSYLQRQDFSAAIKWLEPLSNNFKSPCRQQAEFYVALTYLKNQDFDRCIEKMERIAYSPAHAYHDQISQSVISNIKMLKWK